MTAHRHKPIGLPDGRVVCRLCGATKRKRRPTGRRLLREFMRGLSFVGLARKYGMTSAEVQAAVRRVAR